jgi:hypothetical protein
VVMLTTTDEGVQFDGRTVAVTSVV